MFNTRYTVSLCHLFQVTKDQDQLVILEIELTTETETVCVHEALASV